LQHLLSKKTWAALAAAILVFVMAATARADKVRETSGIGHEGQIVGLKSKGLVFKEATGETKEIPLSQIKDISCDQFPNLAKAEAAFVKGAAGNAASLTEAETLYKGMASARGAPPWLKLLVQARMFNVYVDTGRATQALDAYLELAAADPGLVAGLKLPLPAPGATEVNKAMLAKVQAAVKAAADKPYATELQQLLMALTAISGGKPEEQLAALEPLVRSKDDKIRYPAMIAQIGALLELGRSKEASSALNEAAGVVGPEYAADVAYYRGRILKDGNQNAEAALEFMKVAILYPSRDKNRTAEALWYAGQALEAAKAPKAEVRKVYQEAVDKYAGTAGADKAKRDLAKLGA
jgi:hypothetical protein